MTKVKPPAAWMSVEFSKSVLLQLSSLSTISFNDYYSSSVMMINQIIALFRYNFKFAKIHSMHDAKVVKTGFKVVNFDKLILHQFSMKMSQIFNDGVKTSKFLKK